MRLLACPTVLTLLLCLPFTALAQDHISYEVAFPNAVHHEAEIAVTVTGLDASEPVQMRMSRTSPGRYALHEFAKNVYNVQAFDGQGQPLALTRPNPHQWDIAGHDGTVRVTYTLFGDRADGTYTGIDNTHAHMNIPATFMWPRDAWDTPVTITFDRPHDDWHIATQLMPTDDAETFAAPSLYYFMDSPTEISPFTMRSWEVMAHGETQTIRLAVHHAGTEAEVDAYAEMAMKVVAEQIAIYGEPPAYEGGTYTFIADYLPHVNGDGMEHRNSTILSSTGSLAENAVGLLGTLSHEYFHQWNVERLRPKTLEPFDFEAANMSDALWFAEGFTSYYDDLAIRRAGITSDDDYAQSLTGSLNYVLTAPGSRFFSPVEMSQQAPFVDAASSIDPQNKSNTFISYYPWGAMIGLGLDLTLRGQFNTTLDAYMRTLWQKYGRPEEPYTLNDLQQTLTELTGDADFAAAFFHHHVYGPDMMDYEALLAQAGFLLRLAHPDETWLGGGVTDRDGQVVIASNTTIGGPLYEAGLDRGDVILEAEGVPVSDVAAFMTMLDERTPGDTLTLTVDQRGQQKQVMLTLTQDPQVEVVTYETAGRELTDAQRAFRTKWLASRVH